MDTLKFNWTKSYNDFFNDQVVGQATDTNKVIKQAQDQYLESMRKDTTSIWISDHLQETNNYRSIIYTAVKSFCDNIASAETHFYKHNKNSKEGKDQADKETLPRTHNLVKLIKRPNSNDSWGMFKRRITQQLLLTGICWIWRVDNGLNRPKEMWVVPTSQTNPVPISAQYPEGGLRIQSFYPNPLMYAAGQWNQGGVVVKKEDLIQIRYPNPWLQFEGCSPLSACDAELDCMTAMDRTRFNSFKRSIAPSATLETDPQVLQMQNQDIDALRLRLKQQISGPERAGELFVLPQGARLTPWEEKDKEMAYIDSYDQITTYILSVFGLTKSLCFLSEESTFAGLYSMLKQFNVYSLTPLLKLIEDALNYQLVEKYWGDDIEMVLTPLTVLNEELFETQLKNDLTCGARTIKEVRESRGLPKIDEDWVNERAFQGRAASIQEEADIEEDKEPNKDNPNEKNRPTGTVGSLRIRK
jgi:HK97 family phage portal protein